MEQVAAENILRVVSILTAILSDQEDIAYEIMVEADPTELFSALTGLLLSSLVAIADQNKTNVEQYLQDLGATASRSL